MCIMLHDLRLSIRRAVFSLKERRKTRKLLSSLSVRIGKCGNEMATMHRYWIKFDVKFGEQTYGVLLGCGITAENLDEAKKMAACIVFRGDPMPTVVSVIEDIDVSKLDRKHILPNIAYPERAGVWFPYCRGGQDPAILDEVRRK